MLFRIVGFMDGISDGILVGPSVGTSLLFFDGRLVIIEEGGLLGRRLGPSDGVILNDLISDVFDETSSSVGTSLFDTRDILPRVGLYVG